MTLTGSGLVHCAVLVLARPSSQNVGDRNARDAFGSTTIGAAQLGTAMRVAVNDVRSICTTSVAGLWSAQRVVPAASARAVPGTNASSVGKEPMLTVPRSSPTVAS